MADIIERAEAVLAGRHVGDRVSSVVRIYGSVITELVAELKSARADADMWRGVQRMYEGMGS